MKKLAILQMADTSPAESTRAVLECAGYRVVMPNDRLRAELRSIGCDTVLSPKDLERGMGYEPCNPLFDEVGPEAMDKCDLYCDIKAHRSYPKIVRRWPRLEGKILWTRIQGGKPEHVINARGDHGDEVNPPCPVLTPNMWYADSLDIASPAYGKPWAGRAYAHWPPFVRMADHLAPRDVGPYRQPICLIHNLTGWGYGALVPSMHDLGVACYGAGSPDGLVDHREIPVRLANALCMVHLKSNDAPGYALYEALASACPVVCTRRLIWRNRMQDLLIPGETCLVFDRETHDGLTTEDVVECTREVREHLKALGDRKYNRKIGEAGRKRLKKVMWDEDRDGESFRTWMRGMFP